MGDEKLVTVDLLKENMGAEAFQAMADGAINAGANFLAGQATSAFQTALSSDLAQESMELAGNVLGAAAIVKTTLDPAMIQQLAQQLVGMAIDIVTTETGKLIGGAVGKITTKTLALPNLVKDNAQAYFNANKLTMGDLLGELAIKTEKREAQKQEKVENEKVENFKAKIKDITAKMEQGIETVNETIAPVLDMIVAYLGNGPEWVADKLDKEVKGAIKYADNFINLNLDKVFKEVDAFAAGTGEEVGKVLTAKYNATLKQSAKKANDLKEKTLQKGLVKAKVLLQEVNLKLMAITGIAIPLPL